MDVKETKKITEYDDLGTAKPDDLVLVGDPETGALHKEKLRDLLAALGVQAGCVSVTAKGSSVTDVGVTFKTPFAATPAIICTLQAAASGRDANGLSVQTKGDGTKGFTIRVTNPHANDLTRTVKWIAVKI